MTLTEWALRHAIGYVAMVELEAILRPTPDTTLPARDDVGTSEAAVQARTRVAVSRLGWRVWRNNIGAGKLENGVFVRWGLANDSHALNQSLKSGDLIGGRPVIIREVDVGRTIFQFVSLECKPQGWLYTRTEREQAQRKWAELINSLGGHARFVNDERDVL